MTDRTKSADDRDAAATTALAGLPDPAFRDRLRSALIAAAVPRESFPATRIGVVADTHCRTADAADLPDEALRALRGVDLILHCGDLGTAGVLDRLEGVAPVRAIRTRIDPAADSPRLVDGPRVIDVGALRIGMLAHVGGDTVGDGGAEIDLEPVFGEPIAVAVCGTTHRARIARVGGVLIVNPGSPTLPAGGPPTVAILEIAAGAPRAEIVSLAATTRGEEA